MIRRRNVTIVVALGVIIIALLGVLWFVPSKEIRTSAPTLSSGAPETAMTLTSPAFQNGEAIPKKYTCDGDNASPELLIQNVPAEAQSLVLIMDDPDALNGTFVHWMVYDIPIKNNLPLMTEGWEAGGDFNKQAIEGVNSAGKTGYVGPCPHSGTHRYFFRVYALDVAHLPSFETPPTKKTLLGVLDGHILAQAELMGTYARQQ